MSARPARPVRKRDIRLHYDLATPFYRLLWGPHIHHGLWYGDESPEQAQVQLVERLAASADLRPGERVLDVGCGMGASALYLVHQVGCRVTGLTLSPLQRLWARAAAWRAGTNGQARFLCGDAELARFAPASFDVVWSVECTEHLFDRAGFFRRTAGWLRPGGRVAVCAWLAGDRPHDPEAARQLAAVCRGFLCPPLGTAGEYLDWMRQAGLEPYAQADLTAQVTRTWELCAARVRRRWLRSLARLGGRDMLCFLDHFDTILDAYRGGAMRYGLFTARR
jgi:tocopherol O-methyltransferase